MSFQQFQLNEHILRQIQQCGFTAPTPIQQQAIPPILAGHDLLGLAQTGTGKTAAFILPTVQQMMPTQGSHVKVLIIAPTRELVEQINEFTGKIIKNTSLRSVAVYGGVGKPGQIARLRKGVDIVVACPGRLLDLLNDRAIDLSRVQTLILDEADHMFDKGFLPDIRRILRQVPVKRQNLVFSATMPDAIRKLLDDILVDPVTVQLHIARSVETISHRVLAVEQGQKTNLLMQLLNEEAMSTTLVFTRTKHKAKSLAAQLIRSGFKATSLQGNLSQNKRQQALEGFRTGAYTVLVATDIAARGIDVSGISHVINYDMPDTAEAYIHRTGRTGRATCTGEALTFATSDDGRMIRLIEQSLNNRLCQQSTVDVPRSGQTSIPSCGSTRSVSTKDHPEAVEGRPLKKIARPKMNSRQQHGKQPMASNVFGFSNRHK